MVKINWTLSALNDVENIAAYIAKDSPVYAAHTVSSFFDSIEILYNNPKIGRVVPELNKEDVREIINGSYRIIYKIISKTQIDILTVHHAGRLISNNPILKVTKK